MASIGEQLQKIAYTAAQAVHGETVTLIDAAGTETPIENVIANIENAAGLGRNTGRAEYSGSLRIPSQYETQSRAAQRAIVRGDTFDVISAGKVFAGVIRLEIVTPEQDHTNLMTLDDEQAVWHVP